MQSQTLAKWELRHGTRVTITGIPGLWSYWGVAECASRKTLDESTGKTRKVPHVSEVWLAAEDRLAKRYVWSHSCDMLRVVTEAVTLVDAHQPKGLTNA